jgi:hypothetical protein
MKKTISGIVAGFALLSVVGVAQAAVVDCSARTGLTEDSPLCPTATLSGGQRQFSFGASDTSQTYWFESEHGADYVYTLDNPSGYNSSPNSGVRFNSISFTASGIGSSVFDLSLWNSATSAWDKITELSVATVLSYSFSSSADIDMFKISATTWDAGQNDFATGLTFTPAYDSLLMYQNPIAGTVGSGTAPEPTTVLLISAGLLGMGWRRKKS